MMSAHAHDKVTAQHGLQAIPPETLGKLVAQLAARIDAALDEESRIIAIATVPMIDELTDRKSQLALELNRLLQRAGGWEPDAATRSLLAATRARLTRNAALLRRHIEAIDEINATLAQVQESIVSDGTYTRLASHRAPGR